jgi:hypothetical protein
LSRDGHIVHIQGSCQTSADGTDATNDDDRVAGLVSDKVHAGCKKRDVFEISDAGLRQKLLIDRLHAERYFLDVFRPALSGDDDFLKLCCRAGD